MGILNWFKALFLKMPPEESWNETLNRLQKILVPLSGEAASLQGELIRCIANLTDEGTRNGWMNWDSGDEESVAVLKRYLPDSQVFSAAVIREIEVSLDGIIFAGEKGAKGVIAEQELQILGECVVKWCLFFDAPIYKHHTATWLDVDPFKEFLP